MKPHEERVILERNELGVKLSKLQMFLSGTGVTSLSVKEQTLLFEQRDVMARYGRILDQRISLFQKTEPMITNLKILTDKQRDQINKSFTYHPPKGDQAERYTALREKFKECAELVCSLTPEGREQSMALTQLQLANMCANSAIACGE